MNAREGDEWRGEVPCIQKKMANVLFQLSYNSFTIICSHANFFLFLLLTDKTRTSVKAIYFLISVQVIFSRVL